MVAFLSPGDDEALVVWSVAMEQTLQVAVAFWSYESRKQGGKVKLIKLKQLSFFKIRLGYRLRSDFNDVS